MNIDYSYLIGQKKDNLTVNTIGMGKNGKTRTLSLFCTCTCGKESLIRPKRFLKFKNLSCGCQKSVRFKKIVTKDNRTKSKSYVSWVDMISRCHNESNIQYHRYGGRGIKVCEDWRNDFWIFFKDMGERPKGLTIERINNNDGYYKDNCKWATPKEQAQNRRLPERKIKQIINN